VAHATVSAARVRPEAAGEAAELCGSTADGRWQLGDINRNILTGYLNFFILANLKITPERSIQLG
jgi:hypothetical protein